jgi:hypothetical protein
MSDETPAAPAAAPVVVPATPIAPASTPLFGIGLPHLVGAGVAGAGVGALDYLTGLTQPVVHQLIVGGAPSLDFEKSVSTLAALAVIGVAGLITRFTTRSRAVPAASSNGDSNA